MIWQQTTAGADAGAIVEDAQFLRSFLDRLPGMTYRIAVDAGETVEFISDGCVALTGYTPGALLADRTLLHGKLIHPDDYPQVCASLQSAIDARAPFALSYRLQTAGGARKRVTDCGHAVFDADRCTVVLEGFIVEVRDATVARADASVQRPAAPTSPTRDSGYQRADPLLGQHESKYRTLVENLPDIIIRFDRDLRHRHVSPIVEETTGLSPSVMIGNDNRKLGLPEEMVVQWDQQLQQVFDTGAPTSIEFELSTPEGLEHFSTRLIPEFDDAGQVQSILSITHNTTTTKNAELALKNSEQRYWQMIETAQEGIWIIDAQAYTTFVNQSMAVMLGYTAEEMKGKHLFFFMDGEGRELATTNLARRRQGIAENHEFRFMHKDGHAVWALLSTNPIQDEQGGYMGSLAMITDITDRKRAEVALAQYTADLERSNRELEEFAYVASHDLQEPLRMVASYVQLLARDYSGRLDADADEYINFAVDGARRMQQIISGLLTYSRVSTRGRPLVPVDCNLVMADVLDNLLLNIDEVNATVECARLPVVMGDRIQLYQVFQNLLTNALKYHSSEPPHVEIGANPAPPETRMGGATSHFWRFWVRDNGIGIDPLYFDRIFVMFQRLHSRELYPGTGMGLAICKKIIERHGGRVWVESTPCQGSTFYFTLLGAESI